MQTKISQVVITLERCDEFVEVIIDTDDQGKNDKITLAFKRIIEQAIERMCDSYEQFLIDRDSELN